jgi:hypothetical protein
LWNQICSMLQNAKEMLQEALIIIFIYSWHELSFFPCFCR